VASSLAPLLGGDYKQHKLDPEDPANIEAAEIMAKLHDALLAGGFSGHDLRVLLVRLVLHAKDTMVTCTGQVSSIIHRD
jgi:hypothetical protein